LLLPVDDEHPGHLILGVLLTLRYLMPLLQHQVNTSSLKGSFGVMRKEAEVQPTPEQLLQAYELTLHYTQHWDHNVVTAALELLQQMFRTPPLELLHMLITAGSIPHATVLRQDTESRARSGSILELIGKILSGEEDGLEDDPEKAEVTAGAFTDGSSAAQVDIITEQPRSSQHTLQPSDSVDLSASSDQGGGGGTSASGTPESPNENEEEMLSRSSSGTNVTPETADYTTPENAVPEGGGPLGEGGTAVGTNDRSLPPSDSSQTTTEGPDSAVTPSDVAELVRLIPDKEVRVSVKALAVSCVGAAAALHPEAFFNSLYLEPLDGVPVAGMTVNSVLKTVLLVGATAILCGAIIQAALTKTRYNIHTWLAGVQSATGNPLSLVDLVPLLQKTLKDDSSVTCKMACAAVRHCIVTLCSSTLSELGLQLVIDLFALRDSSYWLVRTELLETLSELDFRLVPRLFFDCDQGQVDPVVAIARDQSSVFLQLLMHETQPPSHKQVTSVFDHRFYSLSQSSSAPASSTSSSSAPDSERKTLTVGTANMVLSLLSSAWFPLDLAAHQDALLLCGNMLAGEKSVKFPICLV
ncbi:hypothetical protein XENOCAPTIV_003972, partial [Xenoophorus captivus]